MNSLSPFAPSAGRRAGDEGPGSSERPNVSQSISLTNKQRAENHFALTLGDKSPSVVREAEAAVLPYVHQIDGGVLYEILRHTPSGHAQRSIVQLIFEKGKWDGLPWVLRASCCDNEATKQLAERFTEAWFTSLVNRIFTTPTPAQAHAIREAFKELSACRSDYFQFKVESWLKGANILNR